MARYACRTQTANKELHLTALRAAAELLLRWADRKSAMPGCVLRVTFATENQLDESLRWLPFEVLAVFRKGQLPRPTAKRVSSMSGFNVLVSEHDGRIVGQVADAAAFLSRHHAVLQRLVQECEASACLDFGVDLPEDLYARTSELPASLLRACGALDVSIQVTVYRSSSRED